MDPTAEQIYQQISGTEPPKPTPFAQNHPTIAALIAQILQYGPLAMPANVSSAARRPGFADVYHGSTTNPTGTLEPRPGVAPLSEVSLSQAGVGTTPRGTPAISFATTPGQANAFADTNSGRMGDFPAVYRRRLDTQGFPTINWSSQSSSPEWTPWDWETMLKVLSNKGAPGALVKGMGDRSPVGRPIGNDPQYVVLDPSRVHDWNFK